MIKTVTPTDSVQLTAQTVNHKFLVNYFLTPLKAGFSGFATILMIIFISNLFLYTLGSNEKLTLDAMDLLLAGVGFFLQSSANLVKNFAR